MRATELRLGNLVNHVVFGIVSATMINDTYIQHEYDGAMFFESNEYFEPIPLTEEWLDKFGFNKEECFYILKGVCLMDEYDGRYRLDGQSDCYIKHVHQLQNLYHSLVGEELEVKDV